MEFAELEQTTVSVCQELEGEGAVSGSSVNSREVSQDLGLDCLVGGVGESFSHQLHRPFGNSTLGFPVADYLSQRERRDHGDGMGLEKVAQLAPSEDHHV